MRDVRAVFERWGKWAAHEENRTAWPSVCATFRDGLPSKFSLRPSCSDNEGLIIDSCVPKRAGGS
ncbi:antiterminator Q family protein [Yersinia pekkanenii]|uniref:antiterminator Q family protein n=1 Tax=Yersinia pekkanenii TaxID=1288385 RepID=UPI00092D13EA